MRMTVLVCAALLAGSASAAEDYRVMKLEQDMRTLERQLQALQRQLQDIQQQASRAGTSIELSGAGSPTPDPEQQWLKADIWNRVRPGMDELQVIEILGKPTALRPDSAGRRSLLYTLEIGTTAFLTGAVSFENGKVVDVQRPALK
jgi:outer membrane protein assembly factor BamE (lipoprotein component of BamABCDE complex)